MIHGIHLGSVFMENYKVAKDRLLFMHSRLIEGKILYNEEETERFGCSLCSILRDIDNLRSFFIIAKELRCG